MFDIGPEKLLIILAVVFIVLGPKELPSAARRIGEAMRQLRSLQDRVRSELNAVIEPPSTEVTHPDETDVPDRSHPKGDEVPGLSHGPDSFL
jgi:Tat protein translocase TatB subunit